MTREELQAKIDKGENVYYICGNNIEKKSLKNKYTKFIVDEDGLYEFNEMLGIGLWKHRLNKLFNTKQEAEWQLEFGNIERTERLILPTWEEMYKDMKNVPSGTYTIAEFDDLEVAYTKHNDDYIGIYGGIDFTNRQYPATKENYYKICRLAKGIFLGKEEQ